MDFVLQSLRRTGPQDRSENMVFSPQNSLLTCYRPRVLHQVTKVGQGLHKQRWQGFLWQRPDINAMVLMRMPPLFLPSVHGPPHTDGCMYWCFLKIQTCRSLGTIGFCGTSLFCSFECRGPVRKATEALVNLPVNQGMCISQLIDSTLPSHVFSRLLTMCIPSQNLIPYPFITHQRKRIWWRWVSPRWCVSEYNQEIGINFVV